MKKRIKLILILVASIILILAITAVVEKVSLSSKTVDEAFERFINSEFKAKVVQNELGDKEFYGKGSSIFVPFEISDSVSLVQFEKGIFGWERTYYSHNSNDDYSYSTVVDELNGDILLHGVIPKDVVTEIKTIKVNGKNADIVMLNDKSGIWIMADNQNKDNFDNIKIEFLNEVGNVIAEI